MADARKIEVQVKAGEWVQPVMRGYMMVCCDCSLVHRMNFRIKKGRVQLQAFRSDKYTRYWRRKYRIRVTTSRKAKEARKK